MHPRNRNKLYSGLIHHLNSKMSKKGYKIKTEFNKDEMTFRIWNENESGEVIYFKEFGYHKETEKDGLISRAYEEYIMDMFEYGIVMNNESYLAKRK